MQFKMVMLAQWFAATMLASVAWFIAQASTVDTVERWVGGTLVSGAAVAVVYFTLRFSTSQKDSWTNLIKNEREDSAQARQDRDDARRERDEYRVKYDRERELRMALEERGISDRRKSLEEKESR